ncbi:DUF2147 domain-containing protein [Runella slithyformis]|uniref:DUF2147 domain-containing protein n=1 Tax=Runella slithyformis (strain ATCC 29530 / DSM 19594 / LMG 11500 / NCIMB 11436 / LSU 4) TaxID=761193 RepID=A0A7U3ZG50_RUNSL|nr:DUF2147 domain-containing protein [Runella slithyformis]AEI46609.1 Protein of unknown function DUF2147 [Runella slithyformis DSM 19594]
MKTLLISASLLLVAGKSAFSQKADDIVGEWLNAEKDGRIQIYKSGNRYFGKLIWGQNIYESDGKTLRKDIHNSDATLKGRTLLNIPILESYEFQKGEWRNGKVYDPRSGKTYDGILKLNGDKLAIRGFVKVEAFGKTTVWTRAQ